MPGYPSDWNSRRKNVYERDGYECQNCGAYGGTNGDAELHAHHIVPISNNGTHKMSNLVCMCRRCHDAIHGNRTAPNTDNVEPTTSEPSTLEVGQFRPKVQGTVRVYNAIVRLNNQGVEISDAIEDLQNCANRCAKAQEASGGLPEALKWRFRRKHGKAKSELDSLRVRVNELRQILDEHATDQIADDGELLLDAYRRFTRTGTEYFDVLDGVVSVSDDDVVVHSTRTDAEYEVALAATVDELEEVADYVKQVMTQFLDSVNEEIFRQHYSV